MLSNKPYLMRAFYDWIVDSGCVPIMIARADYPQAVVPQDYVENGEIVLNIAPIAIRDLSINDKVIQFKTSFSTVVHLITVPLDAVIAIYADENGQGIFFDEDGETGQGSKDFSITGQDTAAPSQSLNTNDDIAANNKPGKAAGKPSLKLVE